MKKIKNKKNREFGKWKNRGDGEMVLEVKKEDVANLLEDIKNPPNPLTH